MGRSLKVVRKAIESSSSEHVPYLVSLIDEGNIESHKTKRLSEVKQRWGTNSTDLPHIYTDLDLPPIQELQELCLRDLKETREYFGNRPIYFAPSSAAEGATDTTNEDPSLNLIHYINDPDVDPPAGSQAMVFQSESLEAMRSEPHDKLDNVLHTSMTKCIIVPRNALIPLQHNNEALTTTTLMSGSIIWFLWPPTLHNLQLLQTSYERFALQPNESNIDDINRELEGGIALIQLEGEAMRLPPFCLHMNLATKTSVLATSSVVTVDTFIMMLRHIPLLTSWFPTELNGESKKAEFNAAMLKTLDRILNGDIDPETGQVDDTYKLHYHAANSVGGDEDGGSGPLRTLLGMWDKVKWDVAGMIGSTDREFVEESWAMFLVRTKGRDCKICGEVIRNKMRLMRGHFVERHWTKEKEKAAERVDSMDVGDGDAMEIS